MFEVRACCAAGEGHFLRPSGTARESARRGDWIGDGGLIAAVSNDETATLETAYHEAGHAIVAFATGAIIDELRVAAPACLKADFRHLPPISQIATLAAGPVGTSMYHRHVGLMSETSEAEYLARASALAGGSCDECRMARSAIVAASRAPGTVPADHLRAGQRIAVDVLDRHRGVLATLARRLLAEGTIPGAAVIDFLSQFIAPVVPAMEPTC